MWRKWWLLFSVIWGGIAALQAVVILGTSEETEKALRPLLLGCAVPAALYLLGWVWERVRRK
ncbi:MAG TPA: hypothetical protein VJ778_06225 [Burkholderiales bacterium]|nr:hypothetical protein [Burkholderiales bacterium]